MKLPNLPRIGRRGALLLVLGLIFIGVGITFAYASNDPALLTTFAFPVSIAPLTFWAGMFATSGAIAVLASFWKIGQDAWGFMALFGMSAVWSASAWITAVFFDTERAIVTGLIWGATACVMLITSGMRGPKDD